MDSSTAQTHLDAWIAADTAVSTGTSYSIGQRTLTRADVADIRAQITYWRRIVDQYSATALSAGNIGKVATFGQQ